MTTIVKEEYTYYTDKELEYIYGGYSVIKVNWNSSGISGWVDLEKEENTITESFIIRTEGKSAFDRWFPEKEYNKLSKAVLQTKSNK